MSQAPDRISFIIDTHQSTFPQLDGPSNTADVSSGIFKAVGEIVKMEHPDTSVTVIGRDDGDRFFEVSVKIPKSTTKDHLLSGLKDLHIVVTELL